MTHDPHKGAPTLEQAKAATPKDELERSFMSYNTPKSEREWWAMHEIERLRSLAAQQAQESPARWTQADIERIDRDAEMILSKMKPPPVADQESPAGSALIAAISDVLDNHKDMWAFNSTLDLLQRARDRLSALERENDSARRIMEQANTRLNALERELAEARAIPREPTEAMFAAVEMFSKGWAGSVWIAMYDAALAAERKETEG